MMALKFRDLVPAVGAEEMEPEATEDGATQDQPATCALQPGSGGQSDPFRLRSNTFDGVASTLLHDTNRCIG